MRQAKCIIILVLLAFIFTTSFERTAYSAPGDIQSTGGGSSDEDLGKDMMLMAIYGTVSGMIIGAASLAFTDKALTKLRNIAIGASVGLYVGILLGGLVFLDRSVGSSGGMFDDMQDEEIPIVRLNKDKLKFSFPSLLLTETTVQIKSEPNKFETKSWLGASLLKITF